MSLAQPSTGVEIGWLGLFNRDLVEWLENENQLVALCSMFVAESDGWRTCRAEMLASKRLAVPLWQSAAERAAPAGSLLLVATPGQGLKSFYVPVDGGVATEFRPDLFDADWGYGPHFHQTFLERRGSWFRLPEVPFPRGTWINATQLGGDPDVRLLAVEQIVSGPLGDLFVLGIGPGVLRVRPEQPSDMWCEGGNPPPLSPWQEIRIPLPDLYTPTGHLRLQLKYTRGC